MTSCRGKTDKIRLIVASPAAFLFLAFLFLLILILFIYSLLFLLLQLWAWLLRRSIFWPVLPGRLWPLGLLLLLFTLVSIWLLWRPLAWGRALHIFFTPGLRLRGGASRPALAGRCRPLAFLLPWRYPPRFFLSFPLSWFGRSLFQALLKALADYRVFWLITILLVVHLTLFFHLLGIPFAGILALVGR